MGLFLAMRVWVADVCNRANTAALEEGAATDESLTLQGQ